MGVVHGAPVRPAMVVAALVSWARERLGSALYRQGRRGRSSWGEFTREDDAGGGAHGRGSSAGHGSRRGEHRKGGGAWRALVAPGKSGFVK